MDRQSSLNALVASVDRLCSVPDIETAAQAIGETLGDASAALVVKHPARTPASCVLADYPAGIGAAVVGHDQIILERIW